MKKNLTQLSYRLLLLFPFVFIFSVVTAGTINLPAVSSSIIFTNPIQNNNMFLGVENTATQEGYTLPATILGAQCREIPAGKFMYVYSSRTAVPTSATNIIISITYYDSSMNSIWINYTRNGNAGGWGTADFQKSNTKKWITRIITITDAGLDGSMGYGGDIRMGFGGENNYIKDISISVGTLNPSAEPVPAKVNAPGAEFIGKSFAGYQLWHQAGATPQDWLHWSYGMLPAAGRGNHNTETFPHISDYNGNQNVTMYPTNFANLGDGSPAKLYNSTDQGVIDVQMSLLKNAGFDGVAIQRNAPIGRALKASPDDYYVSIKNACENNGRLFYVMYCMPDTNNGSAHLEDVVAGIERDWVYQMEQVYALTSSSAYATVNGKPVVELWGLGYSTIEINNPQALALAAFFKARGCYVIAGTPRDWRLMNEGSRTDFSNVYKSYDMISPWTVGAYNDTTSANNYKTNYEVADKSYCDANGMGYYPVVFVGSAWSEPVSGYPNDTKRVGGKFLWKQAQNANSIGVKSMYFAMLDEFEESTDIINAATDYFDIPTDQYFGTLAMDGIWCSPDYYLRLGGAAARMLQNGTSQPTITTPYSLGPIYYRNSFESRVANCIINNVPQNIVSPIDACFYHDAAITNTAVTSPSVAIVNPATTFTKSGIYSTQITGNANGAGKYYYQVSETKIAVKANMALSFWKYSANALGQNTSVDLIFKSGKTLHGLPAYTDNNGNAITPTVARGTVGTWQKFNCQIGKGVLIGDEIDGIAIAYDNPAATGNFNAYFDDIIIQDATDTATSSTIPSYSMITTNAQQFTKAEFAINVAAPFTNAYDATQIALDMIVISPSGLTITQPCFYNSGNSTASSWSARFTPKEVGTYNYSFRLTQSGTTITNSAASTFTTTATTKDGFLHTVAGNNWILKFDDGKPFKGIGEDYAWQPRNYENQKYVYSYMIPRLAANGANFFRTWMCPWNLPLEWKNPISTNFYTSSTQYFNPSAIAGIDSLVNLSEANGMYMMITLNTFGDLIDQWNINSYNTANGGPCATPNDFFASTAAKTMFKNRLRYIIARWGYSSSVAALELFNEIDNAVYGTSPNLTQSDVTQWHTEMSAYIKSIDPYGHMVTTSVSYRDITGLDAVPSFDFNQQHIYSDPAIGDVITKIPATIRNYDASTGKPYSIGEYGYDWRGPDAAQGLQNDSNYRRGLWYGIFSPTPVAPMSWWWELFDDRGTPAYLHNIQDISNKMIAAGGGVMTDLTVSGSNLPEKYGAKCGTSYFIYARCAPTGTINTNLTIPVTGTTYDVNIYNTTTGAYTDNGISTASSGVLTLPVVTLGNGADVIMIATPATAPPATSGLNYPALLGYWQNWDDPASPYIPLDQVDPKYNNVIVAFATPVTGTTYQIDFTPYNVSQATFISQIQTLQSQGRKVLISIGGEGPVVSLTNATQKATFISTVETILNTYGFDGVDIDFEGGSLSVSGGTITAPVDAAEINLIAALKQIMQDYRAAHNKKMLLTMAPETADVQGGMSAYGGIWGSYLPVINGLKDSLDVLQVQLYNTGSMYGIDGGVYSEGTADFIVAETEAAIKGFSTAGGLYAGLPANKVAVGLPSCVGAAGGGFTDTATVHAAMNYLLGKGPKPGSYTLQQSGGYPTLEGMMDWSINYDKACGNDIYATNFQNIFSTTSPTETPYGGSPWPIPGTIQAENYDNGGQALAYNDNEPANQGGQYRTTEGVDVETCSDTGGGYDVGYTNTGEWMRYMVNVTAAGVYTLQTRVAANSAGNSLHVEIDGINISGSITIPNTGGFQTWQTVSVTTPTLTAGPHIMRIYMETGGFNLNYVTFVAPTSIPVISSANITSGTVGTSFTSYTITATNTPTSFAIGGTLPGGLTFNTSTGVISGTPTVAGTFIDTVKAINAGGTGTKVLTITIAAAPSTGCSTSMVVNATSVPTIDGTVDGVWNNAPKNSIAQTISGAIQTGSTWQAMYDATNLYVLVQVKDANLSSVGTNVYDQDGVELFLSGNNSKAGAYNTSYDHQYRFNWNVAPTIANITGNTNSTTGITYAIPTSTGGYTLEVAIPWTTIGGPGPYNGEPIGFDIDINDQQDNSGAREATAGWYLTNNDDYQNTAGFGTVNLTACAATTPTITSVATANGTVNSGFTYNIMATNTPTSYSVGGVLPAGVTINTSTGIISGTPTVSGTFIDTVKATNAGGIGIQIVTITINPVKPVVATASTAGTVGATFSYTISATNTPTSYGSTTLPAGLTLNTSTGVISGTPTTAGTFTITDTAKNISGAGNGTLTITINPAKPVVANASTTGTVGVTFGYTISATNTPTGYNSTTLPAGLTLNTSTGIISGIPTTAGTFTITDTAKNISGAGNGTLTITINPAKPVVANASTTGTVGVIFNYTISGTNTPTSYSSTTLPAGLTLNTSTGVISGTPTNAGTFTITDTAKNISGAGNGVLTIVINPAKPVVVNASTAGTVGTTFSYTISATNTPTSYSSTTLPAGLILNVSTGVISGTPTTAGTFTVTDTAKNISGAGNGTLTIVINPAKPVITSTTVNGTTGTTFSYTIAATNNPTSYRVSALPAGLVFNTTTGIISGTPTVAGTFTVNDTATNISGSGTGSLTIIITTTLPPVLVVTSGSVTGTVGVAFNYSIIATNSPTGYSSSTLPAGLSLNSAGIISGIPITAGTYTITDTAKNAGGNGTGVLTIMINPAKPVVANASTTGIVGTSFSYTISATNNPTSYNSTTLLAGLILNISTGVISGTPTTAGTFTVTDTAKNISGAGNGILTITINPAKPIVANASTTGTVGTSFSYTISATNNPTSYNSTTLPAGLTLNTSTGVISGTPITAGTFTITDTAKNISGAGNGALTIVINPAKPVITSTTVNGTTGTAFSYTIAATNNPISYRVSALPAGLVFNITTGTISGTPIVAGTFTINDTATNISGSGTGSLTIIITTTLPLAPVVTSGSITGTVGVAFNYSIIATNSPTGYSSTILPAGLSLNSAGVISGIPTTAGTLIVTDTAKNAGGNGTGTVTITINPAKPVVVNASITGTVGTPFSYTIIATNNPTSYNSTTLPAGLILNTSTGVISGTPTTAGTFTITDTAKNISGAGNGTLTITINPPLPIVPVISSASSAIGIVGVVFNYTIAASNNPISYAAVNLPAGLTINPSTGVISGTPTVAGTYVDTIKATNAAGTGTKVLTITIVLNPPVITSSIVAGGNIGTAFNYAITATNNPTNYNATALPAGLTINTSTGVISGTPTVSGTFAVTITATNAAGSGTQLVTITINALPGIPVIGGNGAVSGIVDVPFEYDIVATNVVSYNAINLPVGLSINTATGKITGTPVAAGVYAVTITATNTNGTENNILMITITAAPLPVITSDTAITVAEGDQLNYTIEADNAPTSYAATGLPAGVTINTTTGIISGTPTVSGVFKATITATNSAGSTSEEMDITVTGSSPVLMPNPVTQGYFIITLPHWTDGETVNVVIRNLIGKEVQGGTAVINNGSIHVNVPNLIAGNYVVVVIGDGNKKVAKKFTVK